MNHMARVQDAGKRLMREAGKVDWNMTTRKSKDLVTDNSLVICVLLCVFLSFS